MANFVDMFTASVRQGNIDKLKVIPGMLLDDFEKEARDWLIEYYDKYGKTPSHRIVERTPVAQPCFMKNSIYANEPLFAVYQGAIDWLTNRYVKRELSNMEEEASLGNAYPIGRLINLAKITSSISKEDHDTFLNLDRDKIYSQEVLDGGVDFGLASIDEFSGGILPGEVALLGARTGIGKSLIVCFEAVRWARKGKRVMVVSAEMPAIQLTYRMDAMLGHFNPRLFRDRSSLSILRDKRKDVEMELELIKADGGDILFPKNRQLTVESLVAACHDQSPDALIVDGVYLLQSGNGKTSSSWENTKNASNAIKQLAMDLNIPVFNTSQFKRAGKNDGFELEDIAYSDALAQDSDLVIAASREPSSSRISLEIIKARNGEVGGSAQIETNWNTMTVVEIPWTRTSISLGGVAS